jgi:hypothetical protein
MIDYFIHQPLCLTPVIFIAVLFIFFQIYYSERVRINAIRSKIRRYFGFLLERGFEIVKLNYSAKHFGNWYVELRLSSYLFGINQDRGFVQIEVVPQIGFRNKSFSLEHLVSYLERKNPFSGPDREKTNVDKQLKYFGELLYSHYDQIFTFFESKDFVEKEQEYKATYFRHR